MPRRRSAQLALVAAMLASPLLCRAEPIEGMTVARYDLNLGFEINGVVDEVLVEPGQHVEAGTVLVRLNALDVEALVAQLRIRAESPFEMESAYANWQLGRLEHEQIMQAHRQGGATEVEVKRAALQVERDRLTYELCKQRQEEARLQLRQAEVNAARYTLRAPRDGIVESVSVSKGEFVREVTPVLRFVVISTLRVEVPTPNRIADSLRVGDAAAVDFDDPGEPEPITAKVVQISAIGDPASGLRKVTLEFRNPMERAAGETVRVEFRPDPSRDPGRIRPAASLDGHATPASTQDSLRGADRTIPVR